VTSFRQIEANRRNALRSTGPITEAGKHRSRRNAIRHGLCAETVVGAIEDIEDYKGSATGRYGLLSTTSFHRHGRATPDGAGDRPGR